MCGTVTISSFPVTMSRDEAMAIANKKGGPLGRLMLRGKTVKSMHLHYVEYKVLIMEALHTPNLISKTFFNDKDKKKQLCRVIANGSTGGAAWAETIPEEVTEIEAPEEHVQVSSFSLDQLTARGHKLILRVLRRRVGGIPEVTLKESRSVYRPYYVALFGDPIEGSKIRYIPIAADGWGTKRAF